MPFFSVQEQALHTNTIKAKGENLNLDSKCQLCWVKNEMIDHIITGWKQNLRFSQIITETNYKKGHEQVGRILHWNLYKNMDISSIIILKTWNYIKLIVRRQWWDFKFQTAWHLRYNTLLSLWKPYLVYWCSLIEERNTKHCKILIFTNNRLETFEEVDNIAFVIRALGTIQHRPKKEIGLLKDGTTTNKGSLGISHP